MIRVVRTIEYVYDTQEKMEEDQSRWTMVLRTMHMTVQTVKVGHAEPILTPGPYEPPTYGVNS